MHNSTIRDYKAEAAQIYENLANSSWPDSQEVSKELDKISQGLDRSKPSLMFYGIYNAGKSSLLNAVFGQEKASVGDVPETHSVTAYQWGEYTLVDTPGLDGPPEDEKITMQEARQHDIIMFVIDDSDNFDSEFITKKIIEVLETGKPCMVVINRKNDSDKEQILAIKAKMNQNIRSLSQVTQNYEFVDVDAVSALKAKREGKQGLLADSNIRELEYCISNKLASVDSIQMLCTPLENMARLCGQIQKSLELAMDDGNSKMLSKLKQELYEKKENASREFSIALGSVVDSFSERIYQKASANRSIDAAEQELEQEIEKLAQKCMENFSKGSSLALQQFAESSRLDLFLTDIPEKQKRGTIPNAGPGSKDTVDNLLDTLGKIPVIIPSPLPVPIPLPVIARVVKLLKNFIFGKGSENVPDVSELNRQQEEYAQERAMALKELHNQIFMQMGDFKSKVESSFKEQLEQAYCERSAKIDRALKEQDEKNADYSMKIELVANLRGKASELLQEIRNAAI